MADVVILGAGVAGHTAALHLSRLLPRGHTVTVVSPNSRWNWIPSNIWVGVGKMGKEQVVFPLAPVYATKGIRFLQAEAVAIRPEGDAESERGAVDIVFTGPDRNGDEDRIRYDYLVNATGPQLKFGMTEGLGPDGGHTVSVCTADHALQAADALERAIERMRAGEEQTLVVGMGHGMCTCEGAACVASAGTGMRTGSAASMTMMPVVPDYSRYPTGRDLADTKGELGLSGHWMKLMLHHLFLHKAKGLPGWQFIPE